MPRPTEAFPLTDYPRELLVRRNDSAGIERLRSIFERVRMPASLSAAPMRLMIVARPANGPPRQLKARLEHSQCAIFFRLLVPAGK